MFEQGAVDSQSVHSLAKKYRKVEIKRSGLQMHIHSHTSKSCNIDTLEGDGLQFSQVKGRGVKIQFFINSESQGMRKGLSPNEYISETCKTSY